MTIVRMHGGAKAKPIKVYTVHLKLSEKLCKLCNFSSEKYS